MESLPSAIAQFILEFAPLFRVEVFDSFIYLFLGVLIGEAKYGTVRASVFAPPDYQPQRLSDLFCRHQLSHQAFMATLTRVVLKLLYPCRLPARMFWIADSTHAEKPSAEQVASLGWFHRTKRVAGRTKKLKGHCYVCAAHLYQYTRGKVTRWASLLVGALLYVKGRSIPRLTADLARATTLARGRAPLLAGGSRDRLPRLDPRASGTQAVRARAPPLQCDRLLPTRRDQDRWPAAHLRREVPGLGVTPAVPRAATAPRDEAPCLGGATHGRGLGPDGTAARGVARARLPGADHHRPGARTGSAALVLGDDRLGAGSV